MPTEKTYNDNISTMSLGFDRGTRFFNLSNRFK